MIYTEVPDDFQPKFAVVSCYVEHGGKILLLHRQSYKSEGDKWGVPAGKVDAGETEKEALVREVYEETGILLDSELPHFLSKISVRHSDYDFTYCMYKMILDVMPEVIIHSEEHQGFQWTTPQKALSLNLVTDLDECIKMFY
jgi:8-oxo-dGTP diphosphatase